MKSSLTEKEVRVVNKYKKFHQQTGNKLKQEITIFPPEDKQKFTILVTSCADEYEDELVFSSIDGEDVNCHNLRGRETGISGL